MLRFHSLLTLLQVHLLNRLITGIRVPTGEKLCLFVKRAESSHPLTLVIGLCREMSRNWLLISLDTRRNSTRKKIRPMRTVSFHLWTFLGRSTSTKMVVIWILKTEMESTVNSSLFNSTSTRLRSTLLKAIITPQRSTSCISDAETSKKETNAVKLLSSESSLKQ